MRIPYIPLIEIIKEIEFKGRSYQDTNSLYLKNSMTFAVYAQYVLHEGGWKSKILLELKKCRELYKCSTAMDFVMHDEASNS